MPSLKDLKNLIPFLREPSEQEKLDAFNEKIGTIGPIETRPTADLAYRADKILREYPDEGPLQRLRDLGQLRFTLEPELFERTLQKRRRGEDEEFNKEIESFKQKVKEEAAKKQALGNSKFKKTKDLLKK